MTDVTETAVVDHGSHDIDIPIKGHLQETDQPRRAKLRLWREAGIDLRNWRRGDNGWWSRVLSRGFCNHRGGRSEVPEAGAVEGGREAKGGPRRTGRRDNSEWAGGLGSCRRRVNGVTGQRGVRRWWERGGGGADAWCEEPRGEIG